MPLYLPGGAAGPMTAAIEALATTGLIDRTGDGTATTRTTGTTGLNVLAAADAAAARTTLGAAATSHTQDWSTITNRPTNLSGYGITDAQPLDSDLTALALLTTTGLIDRTGAGTATTRATGATGLAVLAAADEAAARTAIGVGATTSRNRLINGGMAIDQRNVGNAQTITAGAALAYTVDRWYAYCTGANVTGQRVQGATAGRFRYRLTGAASVTAIGFGQRIEQLNSADLAGTTATLSVDLANSLLTTVTWTAFYANTADTFGTLASPTRTQFATGTFTVNSTVTRYSTQIQIPIEAVTGIEIVFTVGAQTSGNWTIGNVQLEPGNVATPFEARLIGTELLLCQRYLENIERSTVYTSTDHDRRAYFFFAVPKRAIPTITVRGFVGLAGTVLVVPNGANGSDVTVNVVGANLVLYYLFLNGGAGQVGHIIAYSGSFASSEL